MKSRLTILLLVLSSIANACCLQIDTTLANQIHRFLNNSDVFVFEGKIVEIVKDSNNVDQFRDFPENYYLIEPFRAWTRTSEMSHLIKIFREGKSSSYNFRVDSTYLIYAVNVGIPMCSNPIYVASICDPNKLSSEAALDFEILGKPKKIYRKSKVQTKTNSKTVYTGEVILISLLGLSILLNLTLMIRYKR
ncbi:MAG: hypothetical protein GC181_13455 [Bacteroidetes bacterium]|nr:hypothetical protein [Bacteroidota bacterium]